MPRAKTGTSDKSPKQALATVTQVEEQIRHIRGQKVMLDSDLALAYGVPVKRLNEAVRRNRSRFPADFMFQLTKQEFANLRSQFATSRSWGGRRTPPYAFTEHGAVMLASVLNSPVAVEASIQVVRAFVRLRQMIQTNERLRRQLDRIETKLKSHDQHFAVVFDAIRQLMEEDAQEDTPAPRIGFETEEKALGPGTRAVRARSSAR
jgi:hypothetical protein